MTDHADDRAAAREHTDDGAPSRIVASNTRTASRRPLGRVRRPQILTAAVDLLREEGLWSVRVADVAVRAGTSPTGVIYYFGTKEELFKAAIASADAQFYAAVWPELDRLPSAIDKLAALIVRSSTSEWVLWMDLWSYARRHPELQPAARGFSERWCATITDVIRHGQCTGEFPEAMDTGAVGLRLGALTDGLAVHMVLADPGRTSEHYVDMALAGAAAELTVDVNALRAAAKRVSAVTSQGTAAPAERA
jgi:AcrR family transcriptional regulator